MQVRLIIREENGKTDGIHKLWDIARTPIAGGLQRVPGTRTPQVIQSVTDGDGDWYRWTVYFEGSKEFMERLVENYSWKYLGTPDVRRRSAAAT